jgi:hypothetical protein
MRPHPLPVFWPGMAVQLVSALEVHFSLRHIRTDVQPKVLPAATANSRADCPASAFFVRLKPMWFPCGLSSFGARVLRLDKDPGLRSAISVAATLRSPRHLIFGHGGCSAQ